MRSKKRIIILLAVVILSGLITWRYLTTRTDYIFHDLLLKLAQIEHQDYIKSISVERPRKPVHTRIEVELVPGVPLNMIAIIAHELMENVDEHIHYGTFKDGQKDELFPGRLTLAVRSPGDNGVNKGVTCERIIVSEDGEPIAFEWWGTGMATFTRPYEHPGPDEWYGR